MRVCLIYFTGTYNTRYIAKQISESFINKGHSCELFEFGVNDFFKMDSTSFDLIGLGYPIYGFNSPKIFNQAIRKLKSNNQNYFIFKTSGESFQINNVSSRTLIKIMRKKHSNYLGEYHFLMPYNIHFRFDDRLVKQMLINDKKLLEVLVYNVSNNKKHPLTMRTIDKIYSFFVSIQKIGGPINSFLYKVDKDKCVMCQKCIKDCPVHNIKLKNNRIVFSHKCVMCMRCSFYCPSNAIKIGFLEKWKVNGKYDLLRIANDEGIKPNFLEENNTGFYRCFTPTFKEIENEYSRVIDESRKRTQEKQ